jgi:replication-associated recombination protein RarA
MPAETIFSLGTPAHQAQLRLAAPPRPGVALAEKYRPTTFDQVVGQAGAVERMRAFVSAPYSSAFLFHGKTGVGKSSLAIALAAELGAVEMGGLEIIKSGMADGDTVETALKTLR